MTLSQMQGVMNNVALILKVSMDQGQVFEGAKVHWLLPAYPSPAKLGRSPYIVSKLSWLRIATSFAHFFIDNRIHVEIYWLPEMSH
jgi:hypothetical protein